MCFRAGVIDTPMFRSITKVNILIFFVFFQEKANSKNSIRLTSLTAKSSGQYKCEVSTEGPSFATEYKIGNLTVISELHSYLSQLSV